MDTDFSSNRCASPLEEYEVSTRHPDIYFEDGNLSIVAGRQYFIVHRGLLCRHSEVLRVRIESIKTNDERLLEGLAVLYLDDSPEDLAHFLRALYGYVASPCFHSNATDCMRSLSHDTNAEDFVVISAVLRLATNYGVETLRETVLRTLSLSWPSTLQLWEVREKAVTTIDGVYVPRPGLPHPLSVFSFSSCRRVIKLTIRRSAWLSNLPVKSTLLSFFRPPSTTYRGTFPANSLKVTRLRMAQSMA